MSARRTPRRCRATCGNWWPNCAASSTNCARRAPSTIWSAALDSADKAAAQIATAAEDFPKLVSELKALADKANALDAETLVASATKVLDDAPTR